MKIRVKIPLRKSTYSPVENSTLFVDGRKLVIDEQNLPGRLVRLIPDGYANATTEQWKPFVTLATAMGILR